MQGLCVWGSHTQLTPAPPKTSTADHQTNNKHWALPGPPPPSLDHFTLPPSTSPSSPSLHHHHHHPPPLRPTLTPTPPSTCTALHTAAWAAWGSPAAPGTPTWSDDQPQCPGGCMEGGGVGVGGRGRGRGRGCGGGCRGMHKGAKRQACRHTRPCHITPAPNSPPPLPPHLKGGMNCATSAMCTPTLHLPGTPSTG